MDARLCIGWVALLTNMTVHSLMYYYFAMTALGHKLWWRKYVTQIQITQFVIDLIAGMIVLKPRVYHDYVGNDHPMAGAWHIARCFELLWLS